MVSNGRLVHHRPGLAPRAGFTVCGPDTNYIYPCKLAVTCTRGTIRGNTRMDLGATILSVRISRRGVVDIAAGENIVRPGVIVGTTNIFTRSVTTVTSSEFFSVRPHQKAGSVLSRGTNTCVRSMTSMGSVDIRNGARSGNNNVLRAIRSGLLIKPSTMRAIRGRGARAHTRDVGAIFSGRARAVPRLSEHSVVACFANIHTPAFRRSFVLRPNEEAEGLVRMTNVRSPKLAATPTITISVTRLTISVLNGARAIRGGGGCGPVHGNIPILHRVSSSAERGVVTRGPSCNRVVYHYRRVDGNRVLSTLGSPVYIPAISNVGGHVEPKVKHYRNNFYSPLIAGVVTRFLNIPLCRIGGSSTRTIVACNRAGMGRKNRR